MPPRSADYLARVAARLTTTPPVVEAGRIAALADRHARHRTRCLNLLASENTISRGALALLGSPIATRLTEGLPGDKEFPPPAHNVEIDEIEAVLIGYVQRIFRARFVEWRATSNTMANAIALGATTVPGDRILVQSLFGGGNMSYHAGAVASLLHLEVHPLRRTDELGIDLEHAAELARAVRPRAIVVGGSYMLFPLPVAQLRAIANQVGAALIYDAAHVGLLNAYGLFDDPLAAGADLVTLGTHKVMGGPIGGLVLTNNATLAERILSRTYPFFLQTRDQNKYAAAAHTLAEMAQFGEGYAKTMVANAKALAQHLADRGFSVLGRGRGFTETHQVILDVRREGGPLVEERCQAVGILLHKGRVIADRPDTEERSAVRISVQEVTRQGMGLPEMARIADLITDAIRGTQLPEILRDRVAELALSYPNVQYSFDQADP